MISSSTIVAARFLEGKYQSKTEDADGNIRYEYGPRQVQKRHKEKAERLDKLQSSISDLRAKVKKDLQSKDAETRLTALAVALINETYERVGNNSSAEDGHYGITCLEKRHVTFEGGKARLKYTGKSGVKHDKTVENEYLVKALKAAVEDKQSEDPILAFQTDDLEKKIDAKEVNSYLKDYEITAKDLRGFHANREMQDSLKAIRKDGPDLPWDRKEKDKILKDEFKKVLEEVAKIVGHTPAMLRGQYLVPGLEDEYMKDGTVIKDLSKKSCLEKEAGVLRWLRGLVSKATTVKAVYDWGVEQLEGAPSSLGGFSPLGYIYLVRNTWYSTLGDGFSVERHSNERSAVSAVRFQEARTAKKSPSEKEEEAIEDMVKPKPKKKPPRYDLRKRRLDVEDPDIETQGQEGDRDLSLNYKRIASDWKATYSGVFLDDHRALYRWWSKNVQDIITPPATTSFTPSDWPFPHVTLQVRPSPKDVLALPMGQKIKMKVIGWAADSKAQAVLIKLSGIKSENPLPHITVATARGVSPAYSNDLLSKGFTPINGPTFEGTVGLHDGKSVHFDLIGSAYLPESRVASRFLEAVKREPGQHWKTDKPKNPWGAKSPNKDEEGRNEIRQFETEDQAKAFASGEDVPAGEDDSGNDSEEAGEGSETPKGESPEEAAKRTEKAVEKLEASVAISFDMEINRDETLVETQKELQGFYTDRTALLEEIEDLEREVYRAGDSEKARIEQQVKKLTKDAEKLTESIGEHEDKLMAASPMWESKKSITDAMSHLSEEQQVELSEKVQEHVDKAVDALAAAGTLPPWAIEKSRAAREGVDTANFEKLSKAQSQVKDEETKIKALEENLAEADEDSVEEIEAEISEAKSALQTAKARLAKAEKKVSVDELAESIAYSQIAQQVTFNPNWMGGGKIKNEASEATPEKLASRAASAVLQFDNMVEGEKEEVLDKLNNQITALTNPDGSLKDGANAPEFAQIKAVRDALAVSNLMNDKSDSFSPSGAEPPAGVVSMIKNLQNSGKMGDILKIAEDPGSPEAMRIYDDALEKMNPDEIVEVTGGSDSPHKDLAEYLNDPPANLSGSGRDFIEAYMRRNASHDFAVKGPLLADAMSKQTKEKERSKKQQKKDLAKRTKGWDTLSPAEKRDQVDKAVKGIHSSTQVTETRAAIGTLLGSSEFLDSDEATQEKMLKEANSKYTFEVHKALSSELSKLSGGDDMPESFKQALINLQEAGVLDAEQVKQIMDRRKGSGSNKSASFENIQNQSFLYNYEDISGGLRVSALPLYERDEQTVQTRFRRQSKMATLTSKGAKQVSTTLDRIANLFDKEAKALGIPDHVASDFAYRCDLLSDYVEKQAGINHTALDELDVVKEDGFDPDDIGREVAGPSEGEADEAAYMDGHFTQQSHRELREEQEEGDLSSASAETQSAEPGKQASEVILLAKKAHDEQVMELGRMRDQLKLCSAKLGASDAEGVAGIASAADALVDSVDKVRDDLIAAGAAGEDGLSLESLTASDRVVGAVSEVVPYLQGLCDSISGAGDSSPTAQLRLQEMVSSSSERMEKLIGLANDIVGDAASSVGKKASGHGFDLSA